MALASGSSRTPSRSLFALLPLLAAQDSRFVEQRLSGSLATRDGADIQASYAPSPDGTRVAFSTRVPPALFVSAADGSSIATVLDTRHAASTLWTPDGTRLVYSNTSLYSVLANGSSAPVELAPSGTSLAFSGNGDFLIFHSGSSVRAAPVDGSGPAFVLASGVDSSAFRLDPSGGWVVFQSNYELYSVPVDGSAAPTRISAPGTQISGFELAHLGGPAVYRAMQALWAVPLGGGAPPSQITPTMVTNRNVSTFRVTSDGSQVVYISDLTSNGVYELYRVPSDGSSAPLRLTPLSSGDVLDFRLSPDGGTAVYFDQGGHIFSVPTDASTPARDLGGSVRSEWAWPTLAFTPDSSTLLFLDRAHFSKDAALLAGPLDGSEPIARLDTTAFHAHAGVRSFAVTPDSTYVLYASDGVLDERLELFRHEFATGEDVRLSGPLLGHADVADFRLDDTGTQVFWRADSRLVGQLDLFARPVLDGPPPVLMRATGATVTAGSVSHSLQVSRGRVLFLADATTPGEKELFLAPDDGSAPARRLSPLGHGTVNSFQIASGGNTAVFLSEASAEGRDELFRVALDGSSPAARLNEPCEEGQEIRQYALAPDGTHVVFTRYSSFVSEFFSAPLAGGTSVPLGQVTSAFARFAFTPDSSRVVHEGDGGRVHVSPIDGATATLELADAVAQLQALDATSTRAVYRVQGRLFSVPLAGGPALELNNPLPGGAQVVEHELTPDGAWVVYRADALINDRFLLLRVATDRSSPPLVLNAPMAAGSDVDSFQLTANGSHALYHAEQMTYSVALPSGPPIQLGDFDNALIPPAGDYVVTGSQIVPLDGSAPTPLPPYSLAGFWSDAERLLMRQSSTNQYLSVHLDGSKKLLLTPTLATNSPSARQSGEGLVYLDARGTPGIYELFSSHPRKFAQAP